MPKSLPPMGWFRAFEAAARHLSFTSAAEELGLTQSAISQQIRSLESRLGRRLFIRKHRSIPLTDDGRRLLPDVSQAMSSLRTVTASFESSKQSTRLTIATSVSVAQWYIAPQLNDFISHHPGTTVRLITTVWPDELQFSNADVLIRFGRAEALSGKSQILGSNQLVLVGAPDLVKSDGPVHLSAEDVLSYPLIQSVGTSDVWANCAESFGYDPNHEAIIEVDSHGLAVDFAKAGSGIALVSELIALPALRDGSLVRVHPESIPAKDCFHIAVAPDAVSPDADSFVQWLTRTLATSGQESSSQ